MTARSLRLGFIMAVTLSVTACSSAPEKDTTSKVPSNEPEFDFYDPRDPFEEFNRAFWDLNRDTLDPYLLLPLANTYEKVPGVFRQGFYNFTDNLEEPISFINNILQLKMRDASVNVGRFLMNTGLGFLGFFDVASSIGLHEEKETFGQTMATYGVPDGPYIMLPGAGPTVLIDRGGDVADSILWPSLIYGFPFTVAKYTLRGLQQRIELKQLEPMLENSIDEYSFVRETYFSYWKDKVFDGKAPQENLWDDEWSDPWADEWDQAWDEEPQKEQPPAKPQVDE